jgi:hypothetical protein
MAESNNFERLRKAQRTSSLKIFIFKSIIEFVSNLSITRKLGTRKKRINQKNYLITSIFIRDLTKTKK